MAGVITREHGPACLQHGVASVGEPLRGGVEAPEVAGPRAAVHEQHQGGGLLRVRTGEVGDQLEAIARLGRARVRVGVGVSVGIRVEAGVRVGVGRGDN